MTTRISPASASEQTAETQATLSAVKAKLGMVPNLFATFAKSPAVLNAYLAFSDALSKGVLTAGQREIIALATAQANSCHYCLSAHTLLGKNAGLSPEAVHAARGGKGANPVDNAIAQLATRIVAAKGEVADSDLSMARAAGLNDTHIVEVIANVSLNILTNYTNNAAHTDIDFPVVALHHAA